MIRISSDNNRRKKLFSFVGFFCFTLRKSLVSRLHFMFVYVGLLQSRLCGMNGKDSGTKGRVG